MATAVVNTATTIIKDMMLARMFSNPDAKPPAKIPMASYGLWGLRDCLTILAAFVIPKRVTQLLVKQGFEEKKTEVTATFWTPILL